MNAMTARMTESRTSEFDYSTTYAIGALAIIIGAANSAYPVYSKAIS